MINLNLFYYIVWNKAETQKLDFIHSYIASEFLKVFTGKTLWNIAYSLEGGIVRMIIDKEICIDFQIQGKGFEEKLYKGDKDESFVKNIKKEKHTWWRKVKGISMNEVGKSY